MKQVKFSVPAINCMHCTHTIETELRDLAGVQSVTADLGTKQVTVTFDSPADEEQIRALLAEIEYPAAV